MPRIHLVVSVPFCARVPDYMAPRRAPSPEGRAEAYADALVAEARSAAPDLAGRAVASVRVAGPMPQAVPAETLASLLERLRGVLAFEPGCPVTVDVAPGRLGRDGLARYRQAGVDRALLLLHTSQGGEFKRLGLPWDAGDVRATAQMFEQEGFLEYGVELMYGLPGQTAESFRLSLADAFFYAPKFVLLQPFEVQQGSAAAARAHGPGALPPAPPLKARLGMLSAARRLFATYALAPVTDRAFALPGHEPPGEAAYYAGEDFLGLGCAALSCYDGMLVRNVADVDAYIRAEGDPALTVEAGGVLTPEDAAMRRAALGIHLPGGAAPGAGEEACRDRLEAAVAAGSVERGADGRYRMSARSTALGLEPPELWG